MAVANINNSSTAFRYFSSTSKTLILKITQFTFNLTVLFFTNMDLAVLKKT